MSSTAWLAPDAWLAAADEANRARAAAELPDGAEELGAALADDPRRLIAIVGDSAPAVAHALARAAPAAWYAAAATVADPAAVIAELDDLLRAAAPAFGAGRPVVVLADPPHPALLRGLVSASLHARLAVAVPCDRATASRLSKLAGRYPRASIAVVTAGAADDADASPEPDPESPGEPPRPGPGAALRKRARALASDRDLDAADAACREALDAERDRGTRAGELACVRLQADLAWERGDPAEAARLCREVADGRLQLGDPGGAATALEDAADLTLAQREHAAAAETLARALALWTALGDLPAVARCHLRLAQYADRRADPRTAAVHYAEALARFEAMGTPPLALERLNNDLYAAERAAAGHGKAIARDRRDGERRPRAELDPIEPDPPDGSLVTIDPSRRR